MRTREKTVPTADGGSVLVVYQRHEYAETLEVDHQQVLHKISGRQWVIGHDVADLELVAYAALGWLAMIKEGDQ